MPSCIGLCGLMRLRCRTVVFPLIVAEGWQFAPLFSSHRDLHRCSRKKAPQTAIPLLCLVETATSGDRDGRPYNRFCGNDYDEWVAAICAITDFRLRVCTSTVPTPLNSFTKPSPVLKPNIPDATLMS